MSTTLDPFTFQPAKAELAVAYKYLFTSPWQYIVILAIALSGLAAFVNTYNTITGIDKNLKACTATDPLRSELKLQFIIMIILSVLAVVFGVIMAVMLRHGKDQKRVLTMGIIFVGIFGIIYATSIKLSSSNMSSVLKVGVSWTTFFAFLILGYFMGSGTSLFCNKESKKSGDGKKK